MSHFFQPIDPAVMNLDSKIIEQKFYIRKDLEREIRLKILRGGRPSAIFPANFSNVVRTKKNLCERIF